MSDSFNSFNSIWPNGMKVDEEGYAVFYPLGTNKTNISTITWPEGNKLVSPFVYDKNDKLVGFADTKALEIDNNDTTININYSHFDADLDSIMENTLTINAPENATVNVKYGAVDKVLTEKIEKVLGKGNCKVNFDKDENKVTVTVSLDTTEAQIAEIESLLDRVLPGNLVTEMEWADGLPIDYTHVDYLNTNYNAYIVVPVEWDDALEFKADIYFEKYGYMESEASILNTNKPGGVNGCLFLRLNYDNRTRISWAPPPVGDLTTPFRYKGQRKLISFSKGLLRVDAAEYPFNSGSMSNLTDAQKTSRAIFGSGTATGGLFHFYSAQILKEGILMFNGIPSLNPEGQPGMYDTVNKVFKTNTGTGDFLYPGAEQAVQTTDLDTKSYAKLTEHGVRRLYKVPKGYTGTMDDYAAAHGFKELIEPPMPLEGYWMPEWRETDTQLILDWVETEPPAEEEIQ